MSLAFYKNDPMYINIVSDKSTKDTKQHATENAVIKDNIPQTRERNSIY